jgi:hypothetical protein
MNLHAWQIVALAVSLVLAFWGFFDFVSDEIEIRRHPHLERPKGRKRFGSLLVGLLGVISFFVAWRVQELSDA